MRVGVTLVRRDIPSPDLDCELLIILVAYKLLSLCIWLLIKCLYEVSIITRAKEEHISSNLVDILSGPFALSHMPKLYPYTRRGIRVNCAVSSNVTISLFCIGKRPKSIAYLLMKLPLF